MKEACRPIDSHTMPSAFAGRVATTSLSAADWAFLAASQTLRDRSTWSGSAMLGEKYETATRGDVWIVVVLSDRGLLRICRLCRPPRTKMW